MAKADGPGTKKAQRKTHGGKATTVAKTQAAVPKKGQGGVNRPNTKKAQRKTHGGKATTVAEKPAPPPRREAETVVFVNIQRPRAQRILDGHKTTETRTKPIPECLKGQKAVVYETDGGDGAVGAVRFGGCKPYGSKKEFANDFDAHCVPVNHRRYGWVEGKTRFGWFVEAFTGFRKQSFIHPRGRSPINGAYWYQDLAELDAADRETVRAALDRLP